MSTIGYFPTPLPNEDFRSVLYRYHLCSFNSDMMDTNKELFGSKADFTIFPRALDVLLNKFTVPENLTIDSIVSEHTLLPILFPFISDNRVEAIANEISHGGGLKESCIGKLVGNKNGKFISGKIEYCPCCIEEDSSNYGCSYIHREHQYAFIHSCHTHKVQLVSCCEECGVDLAYLPLNGKCKNGHLIASQHAVKVDNPFEQALYKDLEYLYHNSRQIQSWYIKQRFMEYLQAKGYLELDSGRIRRKLLVRDFIGSSTNDHFSSIGLDINHISQRNTLESVFLGDTLVINVPLILMLIRYFAGSLENFIKESIPVTHLTNASLQESKIDLFDVYKEVAVSVEIRVEGSNRDKYREIVRKVIDDNPGLSRYKICLKCKRAYEWLKRNDLEWLEERLPPSKSFERFDWKEVDESLVNRVREASQQLIESNPNIQIGKYTIMKKLTKSEIGRIKSYIQHLPKTEQALEECAETKEQYQIRHLPALVWQLRTYYDYKEITLDTILAYRRSYRGMSDEMKKILSEILKIL